METETYNPKHRGESAGVLVAGSTVYEHNRASCACPGVHGSGIGHCPRFGADFYAGSDARHRATS